MTSTYPAADVTTSAESPLFRRELGADHRRRLRRRHAHLRSHASRLRPRTNHGVSMVKRERQRHHLCCIHRHLARDRAMAFIGSRRVSDRTAPHQMGRHRHRRDLLPRYGARVSGPGGGDNPGSLAARLGAVRGDRYRRPRGFNCRLRRGAGGLRPERLPMQDPITARMQRPISSMRYSAPAIPHSWQRRVPRAMPQRPRRPHAS